MSEGFSRAKATIRDGVRIVDANMIRGVIVDVAGIGDKKVLVYNATTKKLEYKAPFLRLDGSNKMTDDLDLDIYSLLCSTFKIKPIANGFQVLNLAETEYRDIWCRNISSSTFKFPIAVPPSPIQGSVWFDITTKLLKIYGGFPPAWYSWVHQGGDFSAGDITGLAGKTLDFPLFKVSGVAGVDGSFTTVDGKTVTVTKGLVTSIV